MLQYLVAAVQLPNRKEQAPRASKEACHIFSLSLSDSAKKVRYIKLFHVKIAPSKAKNYRGYNKTKRITNWSINVTTSRYLTQDEDEDA